MEYTQLTLHTDGSSHQHEILMALLGEIGFDSFEETEATLLAYVPTSVFDQELFDATLENLSFRIIYEVKEIPEENWNAVWESNFEPVTIDHCCHIRAPFHPARPDLEFDLVIEPKMSFGTAHHETTALMIGFLLSFRPSGQRLLDMGSGTGILAILAHQLGASKVTAIDNDEWAYRNALENKHQNGADQIDVLLGDATLLHGLEPFDTIYANINRNILLADMARYDQVLKERGTIFMSGFYMADLPVIEAAAANFNWEKTDIREKNQWISVRFIKR